MNEAEYLTRRDRGGCYPGGGAGRDEVWDRESMFSQLAKRSPRVVVSGYLQYFSHSKIIFLDFLEARSEPTEEIRNA